MIGHLNITGSPSTNYHFVVYFYFFTSQKVQSKVNACCQHIKKVVPKLETENESGLESQSESESELELAYNASESEFESEFELACSFSEYATSKITVS